MGVKLYVGNLPLSATQTTLISRFCRFGTVVSVQVDGLKQPGSRGAIVEMQSQTDARKAIDGLHLSEIEGRLMSVYLALGCVQTSANNADVELYRLVTIESARTPDGCTGRDWIVYCIAKGTNAITGYRRGSRTEVSSELETILASLNGRRVAAKAGPPPAPASTQ